MLASDVLISARDVLSDQGKKRWTDETLFRLLNEGISNFTIHTSYAKSRLYITLEAGVTKYDLSPYAINIDRVNYLNMVLEAKSEEEMDRININWEDDVGEEPKYVIFENLRQGIFRIYPKVENLATEVVSQNQVFHLVT